MCFWNRDYRFLSILVTRYGVYRGMKIIAGLIVPHTVAVLLNEMSRELG
ncbi:hypothetical protein G9U52_26315 [Paenibacillus sp. S3N08]|uniref:Uncharacterized protein n=1 Tax=Paenibacillus agricola TaxID=2716264 RepID=A0ABX0JHW8_9BACL|nr:hypothetical protein [Paenibacillus agricola]